MRTSTLMMLSLGTLLATAGCDAEDEVLLDDDAWLDPDGSVSFRCVGTGCIQSPYVGAFNISNLSEDMTAAAEPDGSSVQWTALTRGSQTFAELRVTDLAKCEIRRSSSAPWESCKGVVIDLLITQGSQVTAAKIEVQTETIDSSGALTVYKYHVKANLDPLTGEQSGKFAYEICPEDGDDGTRAVVMLPNVEMTWVVTNFDDGLGELHGASSTRFTLACDGYAEAKGYVRGKVLPNTGGARHYGLANYNGFTHAMRALYRKKGTTNEYSAMTEHGTSISIKDLKNNPPLFDELDQSPPIVGYGEYLLESVYNSAGNVQGGRKGATCKKPYVGVPCSGPDQLQFPNGIHRRPEFMPPMLAIDGWSDLPDCDMSNLGAFGSVGVYEWYMGGCFPQN